MSKEFFEQKEEDSIELSPLIKLAKEGDSEATTKIYNYFFPLLRRYFKGRFPGEADDLAQETTTRLLKGISDFKINPDPDVTRKQFAAFVWTIARHRFVGQMATDITEEGVLLPLLDEERFNPVDELEIGEEEDMESKFIPSIEGKINKILTKRQFETAIMAISGKDINKITQALNIPYSTVSGRITMARRKIEKQLIYPAGFKRVADYKDKALDVAASTGGLKIARFMGRRYTTDEWVKRYSSHRKRVDEGTLNAGYLLLSQNATPREYATLTKLRKHYKLLHRIDGRVYIKPEDLQKFRAERHQTKRDLKAPTPNYIKLMDLAPNNYEYKRLIQAIKKGELEVKRSRGYVFVLKRDFEEFLQREKAGKNHKRCPARSLPSKKY